MELRAGSRWQSAVSATEVIVLKPPSEPVDLRCGGVSMVPSGEGATTGATAPIGETVVGKRYEHEPSGLLVLCTKGGAGELSASDAPMDIQVTRALPSSD